MSPISAHRVKGTVPHHHVDVAELTAVACHRAADEIIVNHLTALFGPLIAGLGVNQFLSLNIKRNEQKKKY
jgi:hypothetical protein